MTCIWTPPLPLSIRGTVQYSLFFLYFWDSFNHGNYPIEINCDILFLWLSKLVVIGWDASMRRATLRFPTVKMKTM